MLRAARASTPGQVIAIVQPHRYTRLASLFDQFATCFNDADAGDRGRYLCGRRGSRSRAPTATPSSQGLKARGHRHVLPLGAPADIAGIVREHRQAGRLRRVPRRRHHHQLGLRAAGRTGGAGRGVRDERARFRLPRPRRCPRGGCRGPDFAATPEGTCHHRDPHSVGFAATFSRREKESLRSCGRRGR